MLQVIRDILAHTVIITSFVFVMMLVVEYLNVLTQGAWQRGLRGSHWQQYLLAAFLGVTPGCLGAFAVVALFSHRVVSFGALVAAMIATSGGESFVMLAMIPGTAGLVFLFLFVLGVASGVLTDALLKIAGWQWSFGDHELDLHLSESCRCFPRGNVIEQWRKCSFARGVLCLILALLMPGMMVGYLGPAYWNWLKVTLLAASGVALFIVATVPDHFLETHLWDHVAKVHVPRVFLWTFGALLSMHFLVERLQLSEWMRENQLVMLLAACVTGLIPESGPHLVFLTLYTQEAIPLSVLLASSIVQDGHGMLPLLADSRLNFIRVKAINLIIGLLLGVVGFLLGW